MVASLATMSMAADYQEPISYLPWRRGVRFVILKFRTYLLLAQEGVQHAAQDRLETGADHVEGEAILDAVLVELAESRVDLEGLFHDDEAIVKGDTQRSPHLLGDLTERPLAHLDLLIELLTSLNTAAVVVEEDVACVLHEDRAVEVY